MPSNYYVIKQAVVAEWLAKLLGNLQRHSSCADPGLNPHSGLIFNKIVTPCLDSLAIRQSPYIKETSSPHCFAPGSSSIIFSHCAYLGGLDCPKDNTNQDRGRTTNPVTPTPSPQIQHIHYLPKMSTLNKLKHAYTIKPVPKPVLSIFWTIRPT